MYFIHISKEDCVSKLERFRKYYPEDCKIIIYIIIGTYRNENGIDMSKLLHE